MPIIPSQPVDLSPRHELIGVVGFMIDEAAEGRDPIDPYDLATRIVDEVLVTLNRHFEENDAAPPATAVSDVREQISDNHSPTGDNVVWLECSDRPIR